MNKFELTNEQRLYFGIEPVEAHWEKVLLPGDAYRAESILYFDGDVIKRHIISTEHIYHEIQLNSATRGKRLLLPKTAKGKEKKLTAATVEQIHGNGVYLYVSSKYLTIGNYTTQTTFYSTRWELGDNANLVSVSDTISQFIEQSPANHLEQIALFKLAKRKNIKYKAGDYFCFKLNQLEYGFGRILVDVYRLVKLGLVSPKHELKNLMGHALHVQLFAYKSSTRDVSIPMLDLQPKLPSGYMMDNKVLYGEYEIIGNKELEENEFEFPMSYSRSMCNAEIVQFQWGLIQLELPLRKFNKYLNQNEFDTAPYSFRAIGFEPSYDSDDVINTLKNGGEFDFDEATTYLAKNDLRNPANKEIKEEIMRAFGVNPNLSYIENCRLLNVGKISDLLKETKAK